MENQHAVGRHGFHFSPEMIAQRPAEARFSERSDARLLVFDRHQGGVVEGRFRDITRHLRAGDVLVVNNAKVVPSLLEMVDGDGAPVLINIFSQMEDGAWHALVVPGTAARPNAMFRAKGHEDAVCLLTKHLGAEVWRARIEPAGLSTLDDIGEIAYPDYLDPRPVDPEWYQTCFASRPGATLFPSAARHFTPSVFAELRLNGVNVVEVTNFIAARWNPGYLSRLLGHGDDVQEAPSSLPIPRAEWYEVSQAAADAITDCRREGGRVVICGTSALRAVETVTDERSRRTWPGRGWTNLIIGPGHAFRACDAFLTNFHMPQSSELRLTAGFAGREELLNVYRDVAIPGGYLFNEFGDSMLIV